MAPTDLTSGDLPALVWTRQTKVAEFSRKPLMIRQLQRLLNVASASEGDNVDIGRPGSGILWQDLVLECRSSTGTLHRISAALGYDAADPFAISLRFTTTQQDVVWVFGRELLRSGLSAPTGDGDVHIWPSRDPSGGSLTIIELRSPEGHLVVQAHSHEMFSFLSRTFEMVPAGAESGRLDLDLLVELIRTSV